MLNTGPPLQDKRTESEALTNSDFRTARRVQATVVGLLITFSVMSFFDRTIMSIAGPGIMKEFGLSETQMGSVYSAFLLSYALLMVPGGHLADRFGPRFMLTAMGLGATLFTGLTALGGRPGLGTYIGVVPAFALIRLGFGACTAPIYPSCGRMNANWVPVEKRSLVWGLISAGTGLGSAISPLLFSWAIARYGWRASFWQAAALTAALALVWVWYVRDYPAEHPLVGARGSRLLLGEGGPPPLDQSGLTPWRRLFTDRNLMLLTFSYAAAGYFQYIFYYWIYYYFGTIRHMSRTQTDLGTVALFLTVMVMTPLGGWVSDGLSGRYGRRLGRRIVPIVGLTAGALLLYGGTKLTDTILVTILLSLALGFAQSSDGPFWASAIEIGGREVGAACGILNAGGNVGGFVAPVLTPLIASFAGWSWGLYFGCLVALVGVVAWFFIDPTKKIEEIVPSGANAEA